MFLNEVMEETRTICNSENWPIWATPENLPFFEDEIYPLFSYSYGSKVPKWKCAHNLLCKKYKNCLKLIKIAVLQPPDWIERKKTPCIKISAQLLVIEAQKRCRKSPKKVRKWQVLQLDAAPRGDSSYVYVAIICFNWDIFIKFALQFIHSSLVLKRIFYAAKSAQ